MLDLSVFSAILFSMTVSGVQLPILFAAPVERPSPVAVITTSGGSIGPNGRPTSPAQLAHLKEMSAANRGCRRTPETKQRMSDAQRGKKRTEESKRRQAESRRGVVKAGPATKAKLSAISKALWQDPAYQAKMRLRRHPTQGLVGELNPLFGRPRPPSVKAKMSLAARLRYEDPSEREKTSRALMVPSVRLLRQQAHKRRWAKPEEHAKASDAQKRKWSRPEVRAKVSGRNSCNWRGGASYEPYDEQWTNTFKNGIRERDRYTCQLCGKSNGKTVRSVHHVDYEKKNCEPSNLVTLCVSCHTRTNHSREYWAAAFQMIQVTRGTEVPDGV